MPDGEGIGLSRKSATTYRLLAAAASALEERQQELDGDHALRSVTLILFPKRDGVEVVFRKECRRER